jgi:hypothetical protein
MALGYRLDGREFESRQELGIFLLTTVSRSRMHEAILSLIPYVFLAW